MAIPSQRQRGEGKLGQRKHQEPGRRGPNPQAGFVDRLTNQASVAGHEKAAQGPTTDRPTDRPGGDGISTQSPGKGANREDDLRRQKHDQKSGQPMEQHSPQIQVNGGEFTQQEQPGIEESCFTEENRDDPLASSQYRSNPGHHVLPSQNNQQQQ